MNRHIQKSDGRLAGSEPAAPAEVPKPAPVARHAGTPRPRSETGRRPDFTLTARDRQRMHTALTEPVQFTGDPVADSEEVRARRYWESVSAGEVNPYEVDNPWGEHGTDPVQQVGESLLAQQPVEGQVLGEQVAFTTDSGRDGFATLTCTMQDGRARFVAYAEFDGSIEPVSVWEGHVPPTYEELAGAYEVEVEFLATLGRQEAEPWV